MLRQHQRTISKAQRELDRERERLERQEKKLIADIKKSAKANQMVKNANLSRSDNGNWQSMQLTECL